MKNFKTNLRIALIILITSLTFQSCSSDDDNSASSDTFIRFTIDGTDYNFENIVTAGSGNSISLNGNNGDGLGDFGDTNLSILFPSTVTNGTYDLDGGFLADYSINFSSEPLNFDFDSADDGTVTFTNSGSGGYFEGTFDATISNGNGSTISVTNGEFRGITLDE